MHFSLSLCGDVFIIIIVVVVIVIINQTIIISIIIIARSLYYMHSSREGFAQATVFVLLFFLHFTFSFRANYQFSIQMISKLCSHVLRLSQAFFRHFSGALADINLRLRYVFSKFQFEFHENYPEFLKISKPQELKK